MADNNKPLQRIVGRLTRDPIYPKKRKDGSIIETSKGKLMGFGLAQSTGYGDDAQPQFFDVTVGNPGLIQTILTGEDGNPVLYKGAEVVIEGTIEDRGQYNPEVWAFRIGLPQWLKRADVQQAQSTEDEDF